MENNDIVKGYKVFNPDWTCEEYQYEVGKTYEMDDSPVYCSRGFHFCLKAADCFDFFNFNSDNKVAEVIALGEVDSEENDDNSKCYTNKIKIVREITWYEVLELVNTGKNCSGYCNTGDRNTGNNNTGEYNTGHMNTGDFNTGDRNIGDFNTGGWNIGDNNTGSNNTGDCNAGNCNAGDWNTGNRNIGDYNVGDWNKSSFNTGCFMTEEQKIMLFNKPSDYTHENWSDSDARWLLNQIPRNVVEWVYSADMSDEEKEEHPTHETTGGYLKVLDKSECSQLWWDSLSDSQKNIIRKLPNFDPEIFKQCTGITVE
ncbi:MAG: hypothetical protein HDT39_04885 [Lachnospiraceae bacterium]|nr:hypothetical protein [Lachnospiraceae bacterium]